MISLPFANILYRQYRAVLPDGNAMAYSVPMYFANFSSNFFISSLPEKTLKKDRYSSRFKVGRSLHINLKIVTHPRSLF